MIYAVLDRNEVLILSGAVMVKQNKNHVDIFAWAIYNKRLLYNNNNIHKKRFITQ